MKKTLYMAVAVIAALSSCSNEDIAGNSNISGSGEAKVFTATVESITGNVTGKSTLSGTTVNWEIGDKVAINGVNYKATVAGSTATLEKDDTKDYPTSPFKAAFIIKETATGYSLPASYTYSADHFNMPMYAEGNSAALAFQNVCGVLAIKVTSAQIAKVKTITVTSDKAISGACTIAKNETSQKYEATATGTAEADKTVTLNCETPVELDATGKVFYLPLPVGNHTLKITVSDGTTTSKTNTSVLFDGDFSVSASKKVKFTKSNIYWDGSAFKFEANQTDYPTAWNTNHVSHFYWSETASVMYAETYSDGSLSTSDAFFFCEANKDNDANKVNGETGYYDLSSAEWTYLIQTRTNLCKYGVTVIDPCTTGSVEANIARNTIYNVTFENKSYTNCLIIAPDGYSGTLKPSYTLAELNTAGLVCLPAAGVRVGSSFIVDGDYWSATPHEYDASYAYVLSFYGSVIKPANFGGRYAGNSLRLVK